MPPPVAEPGPGKGGEGPQEEVPRRPGRLWSNLDPQTLERRKGSVGAAAVLVAGTTVGAGILALPTAAEESGFAASTAALAGGWLYCVATGLL